MISHSLVLLINTMVSNICHIGQHQPVIIWMAQMDPFSHRTSPKIPHCICMTKICAACCHCHLKRKCLHATMCPATVLHHPKRCSHPLKIIQITCASVQRDHHAHHMACSMSPPVNTVFIMHFHFSIISYSDLAEYFYIIFFLIWFRLTNFAQFSTFLYGWSKLTIGRWWNFTTWKGKASILPRCSTGKSNVFLYRIISI